MIAPGGEQMPTVGCHSDDGVAGDGWFARTIRARSIAAAPRLVDAYALRVRCAVDGAWVSLVRPAGAGRGSHAQPRRRRHRGVDGGRFAHRRRDRVVGIGARQAAPHQRGLPCDQFQRNLAPQSGVRAVGALLRRLRPLSQYAGQCDRDQALGRPPRFPLADRGHVQLSHAARARGDRASAPRRCAGALSGGDGPSACGAMVGKRGERAADGYRIREICLRQASHGAKSRRWPWRGELGRKTRHALAARAVGEEDQRASETSHHARAWSFGGDVGQISVGLLLLVIRCLLFNLLFYLNLLVQIIAALPTLLMPRWGIIAVATFWARTNLWLLRAICGIKAEFRGLGKIPPGPLLVSSKHQSLWETFALLLI